MVLLTIVKMEQPNQVYHVQEPPRKKHKGVTSKKHKGVTSDPKIFVNFVSDMQNKVSEITKMGLLIPVQKLMRDARRDITAAHMLYDIVNQWEKKQPWLPIVREISEYYAYKSDSNTWGDAREAKLTKRWSN